MKTFNKMTEKQMQSVNGGFAIFMGILAACLGIGSAVGGITGIIQRNK